MGQNARYIIWSGWAQENWNISIGNWHAGAPWKKFGAENRRLHIIQEIHVNSIYCNSRIWFETTVGCFAVVSQAAFGFSYWSEIGVCIKLVDHEFPSEHFHVGVYSTYRMGQKYWHPRKERDSANTEEDRSIFWVHWFIFWPHDHIYHWNNYVYHIQKEWWTTCMMDSHWTWENPHDKLLSHWTSIETTMPPFEKRTDSI